MKPFFDLREQKYTQGILPKLYSDEDILESAFEEFRNRGFPYPDMTIAEMKIEINKLRELPISQCRNSVIGYKIADFFNKHRFERSAINNSSPIESFMDNTRLKKALYMSLGQGDVLDYNFKGFMGIVNGTQQCSNFRPAFAKYIYTKYCKKNGKIFDPSFGYGGRLVGFLSSYCTEYVGTDPNTLSYKANKKLCHTLNNNNKIKLYNLPIEEFETKKYLNYFDLSFTSPPYFKKEIYSDEKTQSCNRYPEYEDWIKYFLNPFFEKQYALLKENCFCITNIEDIKMRNKKYELIAPSIRIARMIGFKFVKKKYFNLNTARRRKNENEIFQYEKGKETILIFKKEN